MKPRKKKAKKSKSIKILADHVQIAVTKAAYPRLRFYIAAKDAFPNARIKDRYMQDAFDYAKEKKQKLDVEITPEMEALVRIFDVLCLTSDSEIGFSCGSGRPSSVGSSCRPRRPVSRRLRNLGRAMVSMPFPPIPTNRRTTGSGPSTFSPAATGCTKCVVPSRSVLC